MRFADRIIYVTGAASGIGRAAAQRFAAEGGRVFAVDVNGDGLRETLALIDAAGGTTAGAADGGTCDVASPSSVQASIAAAVRRFGGLHVLVNAAGVGGFVRLEEIDEAEWMRVIGVNLNGPFHTTSAALPHLLQQRGASIVNVTSTAAMRGQAYCSHYAASKAGLLNFTRSIALEFATRGLRANCVSPGSVRSPLLRHFIPREDFENQLINYCRPPVPKQLFEPEQVAQVIAFLASDEAAMINGAALVTDGGTLA